MRMTKVFTVGGFVRDKVMGVEPKDRDWVVVGSTPEEMASLGFKKVGADFPIFLHPESKEQYALARKERKVRPGYRGFEVDFDPSVTLEDDLSRRDFTINAMAMVLGTNEIIDPFGGCTDIRRKVLRAVSTKSFSEDPLRILRMARFSARFMFDIESETLEAAKKVVCELQTLSPERIFSELSAAFFQAVRPSSVLRILESIGALEILLPEISVLRDIPQPIKHHPEGPVLEHVMLCMDNLQWPTVKKLWAVLLHDTGKAKTNPLDWPKHHGHEIHSGVIARSVLTRLKTPTQMIRFAERVGALHMDAHRWAEKRPGSILDWFQDLRVLRDPSLLTDYLDVFDADWGGRVTYDVKARRRNYLLDALKSATAVDLSKYAETAAKKERKDEYWNSVFREEACRGIREAQIRHKVRE